MELRVLRYFQAVVNELNISRAAERLHVSQPTISRQLKDLENELGVTLFDRNGHNLKLTNSGEYFANQVNQILALTDKTVENIHREQEIVGSIVIGSAESRSFLNIAQSINAMHHAHPKIKTNIISTNSEGIRANLKSGNYDFGIVMEPTDKSEYNFLKLPGESRWGLLLPRKSPLAKKDHLSFDDLDGKDIIISRQHGVVDQFREWSQKDDPKFNVVATYNLLYNASLMVSAGVGYALCIDGIINTNQSDLIFIPLEPRVTAGTSLVWYKGQHLSPAADTFLKQLTTDINLPLPK
ncbi:transcription regulator [Companilactobacillus mindensis DSM 14500]|jgi:Transcriptional regulator|uniref:Transcription regulator n=1 Tax=Companilactobacillus mindensis DSM 14500 TaxID=1423770 RepID=A0A0R1QDW8_9LACO|nr:LysR family transcriptional regulator [Companilactobacillus mindensis]KRL42705.1 transcription regulator [Companilactobacillus mindensis DSM 14500]GEO78515.1 LysR family transcriptional regulator [Companilactobacillus mindensis]